MFGFGLIEHSGPWRAILRCGCGQLYQILESPPLTRDEWIAERAKALGWNEQLGF